MSVISNNCTSSIVVKDPAFAGDYPTNLGLDQSWYALHTKSRHEKLVYQQLCHKGIETFLPLRKFTRKWSDRYKSVEEPLFKGYLFVHIPFVNRVEVLRTVGTVGLVGSGQGRASVVSDESIETMQRFVENDIPLDPFPYLQEGKRVYVKSGPLKGVQGFISQKDRHCRLVVSVDALMKSMSVQVDAACVELI